MAKNKIKELVFSFLNMIGSKPKEAGDDVWHARVPESEQAFFNGFEVFKFTFTREQAENHRDLELICTGSYLLRKIIERLSEIPKASRLFSLAAPEVPTCSKGGKLRVLKSDKLYYRQQVIFNFKVQFECDQRRERIFSITADPESENLEVAEGLRSIDFKDYSETPQEGIKLEDSGLDFLRVYLQSCQTLEQTIQAEIEELKVWGEEQCAEQLNKFEAYLDEQKQELLKKRENVSFHLYFFQKEEEIDKLIDNLEQERRRKLSELGDKFALKVNISLINAVVLCVPTVATSPAKGRATKKPADKPFSKAPARLKAQSAV